MEIIVSVIDGKTFVNTTPHPITFLHNGETLTVPPSGVLINAAPQEVKIGERQNVKFVKTVFAPSEEGKELLSEIEKQYPGAFVIGSMIAAQAYPGRVLALCPAPGFERAPVSEKRMRLDKFTVF